MKTTDTALLGHVSGQALSAAALSDLWTMCTGVLLQGRILGTLVGQSVGAKNHHLALIYLRISYVILGMLSVIVIISWSYTQQVWETLGQSADVAKDAGYYSFVFMFMVPAQVGFDQLASFFSAQRIMRPEVVTAVMALIINLLLGLVFVLGVPFKNFSGYGFTACPIVTVVVDWFQLIIFAGYFNWFRKNDQVWRHVKDTSTTSLELHSPRTNNCNAILLLVREGITQKRIVTFSKLYFPAALALSSDFWRMGVIGAMAASIGEREVGLFNASYRILWISLIFVGSLAGASGIKIGQRLGNGDANGAKQAAEVGVLLSFILLLVLSALVYLNSRAFGEVFTNDESYLDLFEECRWPFTCALFFMNFAGVIETIPINMGRTGTVFYAGFVASWLGECKIEILIRFAKCYSCFIFCIQQGKFPVSIY
jgi:MATE family multidrug resistance protein